MAASHCGTTGPAPLVAPPAAVAADTDTQGQGSSRPLPHPTASNHTGRSEGRGVGGHTIQLSSFNHAAIPKPRLLLLSLLLLLLLLLPLLLLLLLLLAAPRPCR
jgi:hypothetical protein